VRIRKAEELLSETDLKVASVAFESGFSNSLNLYRAFNKKYGIAPSAWKKSMRQ